MEYSSLEIPSRCFRFGKSLAVVALILSLGGVLLYAGIDHTQQIEDVGSMISLAVAAPYNQVIQPIQTRPFMPFLQPRATQTQIAVRSEKAEAAKEWTPPPLDQKTPSPIFKGSTGGLLRKAQQEEFYVITWTAKKEALFEMPTGGAAIMRQGPNLLKLARKEQCLALTTRLRTQYKTNAQFYRVLPSGEVQYLHPMDGVYPEKVNKGRQAVNTNPRRIGQNVNPVKIKFSGKGTFD